MSNFSIKEKTRKTTNIAIKKIKKKKQFDHINICLFCSYANTFYLCKKYTLQTESKPTEQKRSKVARYLEEILKQCQNEEEIILCFRNPGSMKAIEKLI